MKYDRYFPFLFQLLLSMEESSIISIFEPPTKKLFQERRIGSAHWYVKKENGIERKCYQIYTVLKKQLATIQVTQAGKYCWIHKNILPDLNEGELHEAHILLETFEKHYLRCV